MLGPYGALIATAHRGPLLESWLTGIAAHVASPAARVLTARRHRVVVLSPPAGAAPGELAVKAFAPAGIIARLRGGKARRTWHAAVYLHERGIGTPPPVACLERPRGSRLAESYFVSEFLPGRSSFKDELIRLFREEPACERFMALLEAVAAAVRRMHDAGFQHNDLGNQNILLRREAGGGWTDVAFVDLNRARLRGRPLSARERGRDLSRIHLPSDLRRVFLEMVCAPQAPERSLLRWERFSRARYAWHCATRAWRHPRRERRTRAASAATDYPPERDLWVWDERSGQAINLFVARNKRRLYPASRHLRQAPAVLAVSLPAWRAYRDLRASCFEAPVDLRGRVSVAISARVDRLEREREWLERLGRPPVHIRFLRHEAPAVWRHAVGAVRAFHAEGVPVSIALVQDREAVRRPDLWRDFARTVLDGVADCVAWAEVGHAINRVKWGFWSFAEYRRFLAATQAATAGFRGLRLTGPAAIDFEYPFVAAALRAAPEGFRFAALSHHMYVDRRGAPENRQGPFDLVGKLALARAVGLASGRCGDALIVSEVNWPLLGTGVYSPVGSPYESPGERKNDPSVTEPLYADYMLRYLLLALCSGMAERVAWWQLAARGYGLLDDSGAGDWRPRPAFQSLATFLRLLGAATFVERLPAPANAHWLRFRRENAADLFVGWSAAGPVAIPLPTPQATILSSLGSPVAVRGSLVLGTSPQYCLP